MGGKEKHTNYIILWANNNYKYTWKYTHNKLDFSRTLELKNNKLIEIFQHFKHSLIKT
jgi:hypothetical protein